jgi:hypothetical protein
LTFCQLIIISSHKLHFKLGLLLFDAKNCCIKKITMEIIVILLLLLFFSFFKGSGAGAWQGARLQGFNRALKSYGLVFVLFANKGLLGLARLQGMARGEWQEKETIKTSC